MLNKYKAVWVTISTPEGEILEDFHVIHYKSEEDVYEDVESVGTVTSEHLLLERFRRYIQEPE